MESQTKKNLAFAAAGLFGYLAARAAVRRSNFLDLYNRVVVITGASRGLGLVLAREFSRRGARVAICARDAEELEKVRDQFVWMGEDFLALACDVRERHDVRRFLTEVENSLGSIDVLVNNAGTIFAGPIENQGMQAFEEAMRTNFWGPVYATLAVLPQMQSRRTGRIVNIASLGGKVAVPHLIPYSASKFALVGFSEGLRAEVRKDGLRVTTICPGLMRTGSPRNAYFSGQYKKEYAWFTLGDSLPGSSISAGSAAKQIVDACVYGKSEVVLGSSAKIADRLHAIMPGLFSEVMTLLGRLLPAPTGDGSRLWRGSDSESLITQSFLTALTREAELLNNER